MTTDPRQATPRNFKPSAKDAPAFRDAAARQFTAGAFTRGADTYDEVRPSYPPEVAELIAGRSHVLDIGAGTGKLTEALVAPGRRVVAVEPSHNMSQVLAARLPEVAVVEAKAEALPLADATFNAITCAQTWHWLDVGAASGEAARVAAPGASLVLCWNTLDVTHPWVLRYSRISHSGDVHREGFYADVGKQWLLQRELRTKWIQPVTPEALEALARTRSYWLGASGATRAKVADNLRWYLYDRLGFAPGQLLPLPYRTDAFVYKLA
ncbi:class I SAM-dependent methyltransferase [Corynebacterium sp. Q4381]|uniref:class I SAM-dependent methyltransferase n=1 Tax=Corynebacterium sp. Marseille-Q4381 TaxID=3121597 RepID=UPI002FE6591C